MAWGVCKVVILMMLQLHLALGNISTLGGTCETLPSTLHITKEQYNEGGQLQRTCEGDVAVSKCEGTCNSQVQPSVVNPSGFLKDCQCCRETSLRVRHVTLTHCFNSDGQRITGENESLTVRLREPAECRCFRCGDHS